jgi:hypothetical protein
MTDQTPGCGSTSDARKRHAEVVPTDAADTLTVLADLLDREPFHRGIDGQRLARLIRKAQGGPTDV